MLFTYYSENNSALDGPAALFYPAIELNVEKSATCQRSASISLDNLHFNLQEKIMINEKRRRLLMSIATGSAVTALGGAGLVKRAFATNLSQTDNLPHAIYTGGYKAGTEVKSLKLNDLIEIEQMAAQVIPKGGFGYIAGGAGDEWTLRANRTSFDTRQIIPRVLTGKSMPDMRTNILGVSLVSPIVVPPIGSHGLAHITAEAGTAKGAAAAGTLMACSTVSTLTLEQVAAASTGPKWFQQFDSSFIPQQQHHAELSL